MLVSDSGAGVFRSLESITVGLEQTLAFFCRALVYVGYGGAMSEISKNDSLVEGERPMSLLAEAYMLKVMATYQANLRWLSERFPAIFERLMATDLPLPFFVEDDGRVTIQYGKFIGRFSDFVGLGRIILDHFDNDALRPHISVTLEHIFDPALSSPHQGSPLFYQTVEPEYRVELLEEFNRRFPSGKRSDFPEFGKRCLPIALVFGSGFGWHLDRLVDDYQMRHLIIVDTDIERLNLSLYFTDWIALEQRFLDRGGIWISWLFETEPKKLVEKLPVLIYKHWPPYFLQGVGLFFNDYDSAIVRDTWCSLKDDLWKLYRGWGFLDDELLGLRHCILNMQKNIPLCTRKADIPEDAVAFVIGAGPSFDTLLPLLKQYQDRAVIISCGSAVYALARAGITPDFHVEIERTHVTFVSLLSDSIKDILREVPFVASSIVDPDAFSLSSKPLMVIKDLDMGAAVIDFHRQCPVFKTNPTVTNGGLDLVLRLGFKRAYLFGVDLGFRDPNYHHSRGSQYYTGDNTEPDYQKYIDITHEQHQTGLSVEGNFGEGILSTEFFIHSRDAMAISIREHSASQVFNLNDGALIKGAIPLHPEDLALDTKPESKRVAVDAMMAAFTVDYDRDAHEKLDFLADQLDAVMADLQLRFNADMKEKMDVFDRLSEMHEYFFYAKHQEAPIFPLVRGSMLHMGRFLYDCITLIPGDQEAVEFARYGFGLFLRFLGAAKKAMLDLKGLEVVTPNGGAGD